MFQIKRGVKNFTRKQYKPKYLFISWRETFFRDHSNSYKIVKGTSQRYIRIKEKIYRDLSLKDADDNQLIQNILEHPILLERPIIKYKNKAVIGRPPEKVLKLIN